jgi:DNA helicase-2/ATP-dependent DNA helicase PcrA
VVETGLSSDPEMNWRVPALAGKTIVSFSDAHSLPNMGRELTVFQGDSGYQALSAALKGNGVERTLEFFPEEGKYHRTGHRKCGITQTPDETRQTGTRCPKCGRPLTLGVLHRVEALSGGQKPQIDGSRSPSTRLVPLVELLAQTLTRAVAPSRWNWPIAASAANLTEKSRF